MGVLKVWDRLETPPPRRRVRRLGHGPSRDLCLHGLFGSGAFWLPLGRALAADHALAILDLLGFGASPKPDDTAYTVEDHLAYLEPLLEEAGDPWIVLGHSMGCPLAVEAARRAPERIQAVVL